MDIDRLSPNRYPEFQKEVNRKVTSTFENLPQELAKIVLERIDRDIDFQFSEKAFLDIFKDHLSDKIKKVLYYDSPDALDYTINQILLTIGPEQTYVLFQYVLAYISLHI